MPNTGVIAIVTPVLRSFVGSRPRSSKTTNVVVEVSCVTGPGKIREEVWSDETGQVTRYNLVFVNHFLCRCDNGRVLGYDMAHGYHHRHYMGQVEGIEFPGFEALSSRFYDEVKVLRKKAKL